MLPNRMQLNIETEEQLKRLKGFTSITPNVAARLAFFRSIETDFLYEPDDLKLDGSLVLDKVTWLGETALVTELLLQLRYPDFDQRLLVKAWAAHVNDGISALRTHRNLKSLASAL